MKNSRPSTFIILAYSICVLLLPWTTYSSNPNPVASNNEQSIASAHSAMAQPLLWEQKSHSLKGKSNSPDSVQQTKKDSDDAFTGTSSPKVRPSLACTFLSAAPHIHINLPSLRGLIPYSLPPPASFSA